MNSEKFYILKDTNLLDQKIITFKYDKTTSRSVEIKEI